jgi:putative ABC transport system permease protein
LNVVLTRLIATQRQEIAALKAFGYTNLAVGIQYLKLALLIAVIGTLLGIGVGSWLGMMVTELYTQFYKFPSFGYKPDLGVMLLGLGISVGAATVGALGAVRGAVKLPPAEAMRPPPPANYRPTILERLGFQRWISPTARMILRNLERRPVKAGMTSFGIALAVSILVVGNFSVDALNYIMDFQFQVSQRQDLTVSLVEPSSETALRAMRQLPGVTYAEPFRALPSKIRSGHRFRRVGIMGLSPDGALFRVLDDKENPVKLPPEGIVLSSKLAEILEVGVGDTVTIEVLEGERPVRSAPVAGIITEYSGINAYMDIHALNRFAREGNNISGAFLAVESDRKQQLYTELKKTPKVAGVVIREAALQSFRDTMAENLLIMQSINIIFACIIAFGVVYNSIRISFSERAHELASLRVLGFTRAEISMILLGELALLTLIALPVGFVIGYGFASFVSWALDTELYRIPLIVENSTYALATTVIIIASLLSGLVVRRKLDHLDLIAVLKAAE